MLARICLWPVLSVALAATALPVRAADVPELDKKLLEEIKKAAEPIDFRALGINSRDKAVSEAKKRAEKATAVLAELVKNSPKSPVLAEAHAAALKPVMFAVMRFHDEECRKTAGELAAALKAVADGKEEFVAEADLALLQVDFFKMMAGVETKEAFTAAWKKDGEALGKGILAFLAAHPKSRDGADFVAQLGNLFDLVGAADLKKSVVETVVKNFPDHELAKAAERSKAVGKEFVFEFTPVGADKKTSIKDLRGKVVVIDFWATWCGPCVGEMPHNKKLYAEFKDKGVEFIGVSLDRDLDALKNFCKNKEIAWPQVFGEVAQKLSNDWGVEGIPTLFIIDKKGNLRSMEARGQLEKLIPELLAEK